MRGHTVVLDVGKTLSKLTLWAPDGSLVARRTRQNARIRSSSYLTLDTDGIEKWLASTLGEFATMARICAIIPVAHGAAVAMIRADALLHPPLDYEQLMPSPERQRYDEGRDVFACTGSPALPDGLNLGAQLHLLQVTGPEAFEPGTVLLTWPQYWAWLLCGVPACEMTSLGCHTDLWCPASSEFSPMATRRGWAQMFAPLRRADECLGCITPQWAASTGLPSDVRIHCGLHDSNAALAACQGYAEIEGREFTVLSTGTWFIAMRSPRISADLHLGELPEKQDCLVNVDPMGQPVPSSRFMGGREIENLLGNDTHGIEVAADQSALLTGAIEAVQNGTKLLPTFAPGCGPFPHIQGRWVNKPASDAERRAAISLYAALVADTSLDLIGSRERLLIEGRFAEATVFTRALASLRPETSVFVTNAQNDVSYGALRTIDPGLSQQHSLALVAPLNMDLESYRTAWRKEIERLEPYA